VHPRIQTKLAGADRLPIRFRCCRCICKGCERSSSIHMRTHFRTIGFTIYISSCRSRLLWRDNNVRHRMAERVFKRCNLQQSGRFVGIIQ